MDPKKKQQQIVMLLFNEGNEKESGRSGAYKYKR